MSAALAVCMTLSGAVTLRTVSAAEAEYTQTFYSDFDSVTGSYSGGKKTDMGDSHGKALRIGGTGLFYADSIQGAEAAAVSFDLYCSSNTSRGVVELFDPVKKNTSNFSADQLHRTLYIREDKWIANFNSFDSDGNGRGVKHTYEGEKWYHFDIWVNYSLKTVKYYMDGELIGDAALTDGFTAVGGMRYSFSNQGTDGFHYLDNIQIVEFTQRGNINGLENVKAVPDEIKAEAAFDFDDAENPLGYIFDGNEPEFYIDLSNGTSETREVRLDLKITDEDGKTEDTARSVYVLEPHSVKEVKLKMRTEKFGFHTMNAAVYADGEKTYSESFVFSTANMPKNVTVNPKAGICAGMANGTDGYGGLESQRIAGLVAKAGFNSMRTGMSKEYITMSSLEKQKQAYINYAPKYGEDTLFVLDTVSKCLPVTEAEKEEWRQYVTNVVKQFGHIVDKYEVWNEFNVLGYNKNGATNSDYVEICRITKEVVDELDPGAMVYGGATANVEKPKYDHDTIDFIKDIFYNLEGYKYMDGISIHTYVVDVPETSIKEYASTPKDKITFELREWLDEIGYPDVSIISSEIGWSGSNEYLCAERAARYYLIHTDDMDEIYWYRINNLRFDASTMTDGKTQNSYGLIREDVSAAAAPYPAYSAKPGFLAMCNYNAQMAEAKFIDKTIKNNSMHYRYSGADGDEIHALWMVWGEGSGEVALNGKLAEVYDLYGNIIATAEPSEDSISLDLTTSPVYVRLKNPESFYIYNDVNANRVWIKGRTGANERVAAALIDNNQAVPTIKEARQALANSNGTYSICIHSGNSDTWNNYTLRVGFEGNEQTKEKEYVLPVPNLSVTSGGNTVETLKNLSEGDTVTAVLSDIVGSGEIKATLAIVTYGKDERFKDIKIKNFGLDEGEATVTDAIEDIDNVGKIKIIAWHDDTLYPMRAVYTIE